MLLRILVPALLALVVLVGCSDEPTKPGSPAPPVSLAPADGATGVRLDAPVTFRFAAAVNREVVERDFHLISEFDMLDEACPAQMMEMHGTMMSVMADSMMMEHMGRMHATPGEFTWNPESTECTFQPASWLRPQTTYMVHMGPEMTRMMEAHMGSMAGMGGHGSGATVREMMLHFTTMDTTGGGHLGHH